MRIPVKSLIALRKASTSAMAATAALQTVAPPVLSSEFFDHIRHEVYGDEKNEDKIEITVKTAEGPKPVLLNRNGSALLCFSKLYDDDAILCEVKPSAGGVYFSSINQPLSDHAVIEKIAFYTREHLNPVIDAYWRSCSLVAAVAFREVLNDDVGVRFRPLESVSDGFFSVVCQRELLEPSPLKLMNQYCKWIIRENHCFEVLSLPKSISDENGVRGDHLVRLAGHVFATHGPVIKSTRQIGRFLMFGSKLLDSHRRRYDAVIGGVSAPYRQALSEDSWRLIVLNAKFRFNECVH